MPDYTLTSLSPFAGLAFSSAPFDGVVVADRDGLGIATMLARKGQAPALARRAREHFGIELPGGPQRTEAGGVAFAGTGPETWLVTSEAGGNAFAASLAILFSGLASISDQTDGYAVLRLTGARLRETLAKIIPIDLHPRAFEPGRVAATSAAHVGATLWRLDDAADGLPVFEIAVFRSLAASFWHGFSCSAAEFGLVADLSLAATQKSPSVRKIEP